MSDASIRSRRGTRADLRLCIAAWALLTASVIGCGQENGAPRSPSAAIHDSTSWVEAERRGVDYRAVGTDPDWALEITAGREVRFLDGRTSRTYRGDPPGEAPWGDRSIFATEARSDTTSRELIVSIRRTPCRDSVLREDLDTRVTVTLDRARYHGCGKNL